MAAQGAPAEATFHELKSEDTFRIPTKLFYYFITSHHFIDVPTLLPSFKVMAFMTWAFAQY
jgi:hypothetical protein